MFFQFNIFIIIIIKMAKKSKEDIEEEEDSEDSESEDDSEEDSKPEKKDSPKTKNTPKNTPKDSSEKWKTLKHNGILFPPAYIPLPKGVNVKYKGKKIPLNAVKTDNKFGVTAEEAGVFYALKLEQDERLAEKDKNRQLTKNDNVFTSNFMKDWKEVLEKDSVLYKADLKDIDFSDIQEYLRKRSEQRKTDNKSKSKEEKTEEKEEKEKLKEKYGYAMIDGEKIAIGSYVIQPPGLYIGHGNHPYRGKIKARIRPKDVIINVSKGSVPKCLDNNKPCSWGEVIEDRSVVWIASYKHPITGERNYVYLKRDESKFVVSSDKEKFEKARKLGKNINEIRKKYTKDLTSKNELTKQLATAVYLLDTLAIRPGVSKDESKEADTLGLTTLKCENIKFEKGGEILVDFVGKSSIKFIKKFLVTDVVYKNLKGLCKNNQSKSEIFPNVNATTLNDYLKTLLPGLTAKNFRTWKASFLLQQELGKSKVSIDDSVSDKKMIYDRANIAVALALNHKKLGGDSGKADKIKEKIKEYKQKKKEAKTDSQKEKIQNSIDAQTVKLEEAQGNVAIGTSKTNYIDSRIVVAWAKKADFPIEKIYNKTSLKRFGWSMDTESTWVF
jgi:DNA topoisomerase I